MQESHGRAGIRNGSLNFRSLCSGLGCGWLSGDTWDLFASVVVSEMIREPTNSHVKPEGHLHQSMGCWASPFWMSTDWKATADPGGQMNWSWAFANIKVAMKKLLKEQWYKKQEGRSIFRLGCWCCLSLGSYQQRWSDFPEWTAQLGVSLCLSLMTLAEESN